VAAQRIHKYSTLMYRAPEMVDLYRNQEVGEKVDVWALGCILYALCYIDHPFSDESSLQILNAAYSIPAEPARPPRIQKLIRALLTPDPAIRPPAADVLAAVKRLRAAGSSTPVPGASPGAVPGAGAGTPPPHAAQVATSAPVVASWSANFTPTTDFDSCDFGADFGDAFSALPSANSGEARVVRVTFEPAASTSTGGATEASPPGLVLVRIQIAQQIGAVNSTRSRAIDAAAAPSESCAQSGDSSWEASFVSGAGFTASFDENTTAGSTAAATDATKAAATATSAAPPTPPPTPPPKPPVPSAVDEDDEFGEFSACTPSSSVREEEEGACSRSASTSFGGFESAPPLPAPPTTSTDQLPSADFGDFDSADAAAAGDDGFGAFTSSPAPPAPADAGSTKLTFF